MNPTTSPAANEYTVFRASEIDKLTYDYYNMYEKIVRGLVSVASQTPYNPVSNFGGGTIGNFRAVSFSSIVVLTPPALTVSTKTGTPEVSFPLNVYFKKYNLYWGTTPGVTKNSTGIKNINFTNPSGKAGVYTPPNLKSGTTYYFRIEVEDEAGNVSILSPEASTVVVK